MSAKQLAPGLYMLPLGMVNAYLLESDDGLVLIDTGVPDSAEKIFQAVRELGKQPADIRHIILTHAHPDHVGSMAALKRATGAQTYAHPLDAPIARMGGDFDPKAGKPRPFEPAPSPLVRVLFRLLIRPALGIEAAPVDHEINEGDQLPFMDEWQIIHAPGHCKGQVVLLWEKHGGVLIAADTCANLPILGWSIGYEDIAAGKQTLKKLCAFDFEAVCFGHGKAITKDAGIKWRKRWGSL